VAESKRLLVLTRERAGAPFRQRIEPYLAPLAERGIASEVVELTRSAWERRRQVRRAREFDGVLLHRKTLTAWDGGVLRRAARRLIYDFDDAVMYQARSPARPHPGRLRRFARTVKAANLVLAGNPSLADHARSAGAARIEVIPTGLDIGRFRPKSDYETAYPLRLVWIGSRSTLKQLKSFRPVFEALGRAMPEITLRVIADAELNAHGLTVENVPWTFDAEARLLAESDIGLAPLPDTAQARGKCGFKVVQYMAAGLPVVTSPVGVNADYVEDGRTGFWAETVEEWVEAVRSLAGDAALRAQMGRAARRRAETEFDFAVLAPLVCDLIEESLR
jgi:glycosyltransferase involved in cell wall biosynthesis